MLRPIGNRFLSAALAVTGFMASGLTALPALAENSMVVRNFVLSHGIEAREPVSDTEAFRVTDGQAFAFARIQNIGDPTTVSFVWHYGHKHHATVPMTIGVSPGWRTWSSVKLRPGNWRVELVDHQGEVLLEKAFIVAPESAGPGSIASPTDDGMGAGGKMGSSINDAFRSDTPASAVYPSR